MPEESDKAKGPLELVSMSKSFAKGDNEKGSLSLVNAVGFIGFAYGRYISKNAATKTSFGIEMKWLWRAIIFIMLLQQLLGSANDSGQKYKTAKKDFQLAEKSFEAAVAEEDGWSGAAADAYNAQNDLQTQRANTMAKVDAEIAAILKTESEQVKRTSLNLSWEQAGLTALIPICHALNASTNPATKAASQIIQKAAFVGAVAAGIGIISEMIDHASKNRDDIVDQLFYYREVAQDAEASLQLLLGDTAGASTLTTDKSTVGTFDALNAQFDAANNQLDAANNVGPSDAPGAASTSPNEPRTSGVASVETNAADGGPRKASDVDSPGAAAPPAYAVPTASQAASRRSQGSTQAARPAANASAYMAPAGDAVDAEEAAAAGDVSPASAAAGAEGGERVPVDVAAGGTERGQQPSPTERTV